MGFTPIIGRGLLLYYDDALILNEIGEWESCGEKMSVKVGENMLNKYKMAYF